MAARRRGSPTGGPAAPADLKDTHAEFDAAVTTIEALMVEEDQHNTALRGANERRRELETRCIGSRWWSSAGPH